MAITLPWRNLLDEWNPQLVRELKGRLKPHNILFTVTLSLVGQLLFLMSFTEKLPTKTSDIQNFSRYCTGVSDKYSLTLCISDNFEGYLINWPLWWRDIFFGLSIITIFPLLLIGTSMLISDMRKEEKQSTLNFLRLTPQSAFSILGGKLLGVPILLYLVIILAFPLHLAAGVFGQLPLGFLLSYYCVLGASCLFFYSMALLFGLVCRWATSLQVWLGSSVVLLFLGITTAGIMSSAITHYPLDWLLLFNPVLLLPYLPNPETGGVSSTNLEQLLWFYLPVGAKVWSLAGLMLLNFGVWIYWVWHGLKRCFHNPSGTLLSKQQSYGLTACFSLVLLGFALNPKSLAIYDLSFHSLSNLLVFNLVLFLGLILALTPQRQALQNWARYRHKMRSMRQKNVMQDLIWGEKSPALVAVMLNIAIASIILLPLILLGLESESKHQALWALLLQMSLIAIYAVIVQLILLLKTPKRAFLAVATLSLLIVLPPFIMFGLLSPFMVFGLLDLGPWASSVVWIFSPFPWLTVGNATGTALFLGMIGQSLVFSLLSLKLTRQLQKAGKATPLIR